MRLLPASREYLKLTVRVEVDPEVDESGVVLEVEIGEGSGYKTWEWDGDAVDTTVPTETGAVVPAWQRTGRRVYAGPDMTEPEDAVVLEAGRHAVRWRLSGAGIERPVRSGDDVLVG